MRSPWTVLGLAAGIALLLALSGKWSNSSLVAILVFAVAGAIFPPVAVAIGGIVVFYLLLTNAPKIFGKVNSNLGGGG